jgi:hypothetical protein
MRAWEPQEGELRGGGKAWRAFCAFRDLGPERTLRQAAAVFYGSPDGVPKPHQYDQLKRWSGKFDWQARARSLDARDEMIRRVAIEAHLQAHAEDYGSREAKITERILQIREEASVQSLKMLAWPLAEQRVIRDEDGEEITYVFTPARWTKSTAIQLAQLAAGSMIGAGAHVESDEAEWDFSHLSEEELEAYLAIDQKIRAQGRKRPGKRV